MAAFATILRIATYAGLVSTIPPPQCFADFNWNDCGKSPQPVLYYWKTGSRCEVGIWRGCRPNVNMFKDEYECVSTCIFTVRAAEEDWHKINAIEEDITANMTDYEDKGDEKAANETATEDGDAITGGDGAGNTTIGNETTVTGEPGGGETAGVGAGEETTVANGAETGGDTTVADGAQSGGDTTVGDSDPAGETEAPAGEDEG